MKKILFLCTGNSCRSQMAEGWCNHLFAGRIQGFSAGVRAQGLNPYAVAAMQEAGVNISDQKSQLLDEFIDEQFDVVLTVCNNAAENCPVFMGAKKTIHCSFDDPPALAAKEEQALAKMSHYHRVRDEIRDYISQLGAQILEGA